MAVTNTEIESNRSRYPHPPTLFHWQERGLVVGGPILALGLFFGLASGTVRGAEERVPDEKRIELLRFLASRNEANYRRIETWKGTYRFVDRFPYRATPKAGMPKTGAAQMPSPQNQQQVQQMILLREGALQFALDVAGDRFWVSYREDGSKARLISLDGKDTFKLSEGYKPIARMAIVSADSAIEMLPDVEFGPLPDFPDDPFRIRSKSGRLAERKVFSDSQRHTNSSEIFDPRRFFSVGPKLFWQELNGYADQLEGKYGAKATAVARRDFHVTKTGDPGSEEYVVKITYTETGVPDPEKRRVTGVMRLRESVGFLPVEDTAIYNATGQIASHRSWLYQQTDGIWIPKEFHYTWNSIWNSKKEDLPKARLQMDRHLVLAESKLNQPIGGERFTTAGAPLAKGDRFVDRIEQKLYVHDGHALVPASEYDPGAASGVSTRTRAYILCATAMLVLLFAALVGLRIRRRRRAAT